MTMVRQTLRQERTFWKSGGRWVILLIGLALVNLLVGCELSGDSDILSTPTTPSPRVEQQAVDNLLQLYGQALQHEDIDRLQALLDPVTTLAGAASRQGAADSAAELTAFRQTLSTTFRG